MANVLKHALILLAAGIAGFPTLAYAQNIPGPADAGRIESEPESILPTRQKPKITLPESISRESPTVEGADTIMFFLESVSVEGMSVFKEHDIADIYEDDIGKEIPLSRLWEYADRITERYQGNGYFLSRAYVPAQEIEGGTIVLRVTEGYIGEVLIDDGGRSNYLVDILRSRLLSQRPTRFNDLENTLLILNDLPGATYESILGRMEDSDDGAVRLTLKKEDSAGRGKVFLNNAGSRFTGPHRTGFAYEDSYLPLQTTAISGIASLPGGNKLWALSGSHSIKILPELDITFSAGRTTSDPGFTLKASDIHSQSLNGSVQLDWQAIRQRAHNLSLHLSLDAHNVKTNTQGEPLTRDRIRAVRGGIDFDKLDFLGGSNFFTATLSRGVSSLGASKAGEQNLSRADAEPDFTKFESTWRRQQFLSEHWLATTLITGQRASKALYSSEEFGFGGPALGRAYDSSEITGDHGLAGSLELHYTGLEPLNGFRFVPSAFYDIGKIWNIDDGQEDGLSAASAGVGLYMSHTSGISSSLTLAQPLTKRIDTQVYGNNGRNLRLYYELGWEF